MRHLDSQCHGPLDARTCTIRIAPRLPAAVDAPANRWHLHPSAPRLAFRAASHGVQNPCDGTECRVTGTPPKNTAVLTRDPRNRSPYFTETIETAGHTAYGALYELSAAGNYYNIQLQVPRSAVDALRRALRTVSLPPVATVTQAVTLIERRATIGSQLWLANTGAANTNWVLVGGAVATAQEPFYLFRTGDGGKQWSLINYTSTPQHIFPDLAGSPVMLFGSAAGGVIAEVTGFSNDVWIYDTQDGGQTWAVQQLALPGPPNTQTTPQIVWMRSGTLTITVTLQSGSPYQLTSQNAGRTWTT